MGEGAIPPPRHRDGLGIVNRWGQFWTDELFESEEQARRHFDRFWRGNPNAPSWDEYRVVPATLTLSAVPPGAPPMKGWQAIETAPRDGRTIRATRRDGRRKLEAPKDASPFRWDGARGVWEQKTHLGWGAPFFEPTHWAEDPEPPDLRDFRVVLAHGLCQVENGQTCRCIGQRYACDEELARADEIIEVAEDELASPAGMSRLPVVNHGARG